MDYLELLGQMVCQAQKGKKVIQLWPHKKVILVMPALVEEMVNPEQLELQVKMVFQVFLAAKVFQGKVPGENVETKVSLAGLVDQVHLG